MESRSAAVFLYEDEQGKIQNKLEEWWVSLEGHRSFLLSRHVLLMNRLAEVATHGLDRVFGGRLISWQALNCSAFYSLASLQLVSLMLGTPLGGSRWELALLFCMSVTCGTLPGFIHDRFIRIGLLTMPFAAFFLEPAIDVLIELLRRGRLDLGTIPGWVTLDVALFASFIADVFFIAATRWSLRLCFSNGHLMKMGALVLANFGLALLLVILPFQLPWKLFSPSAGSTYSAATLAAMNSADAFGCLAFVALVLGVLAHRVLWSIVARPLYAFQALGIARRKKMFGFIGLALVSYSVGGVIEGVRKIIEAGAG